MNLDKIVKLIMDGLTESESKVANKEQDIGVNKKSIQVELPQPPLSDSGDYADAMNKWQESVNASILAAIPKGYALKSSEVKEEKIVRHYANLVVERS